MVEKFEDSKKVIDLDSMDVDRLKWFAFETGLTCVFTAIRELRKC